jgi:hypothetical protein
MADKIEGRRAIKRSRDGEEMSHEEFSMRLLDTSPITPDFLRRAATLETPDYVVGELNYALAEQWGDKGSTEITLRAKHIRRAIKDACRKNNAVYSEYLLTGAFEVFESAGWRVSFMESADNNAHKIETITFTIK